MNDARGLKPGQSFWGAVLEERGWTAAQAARMLRGARIAVTDEQLDAWLRPGGDAYQQSQGRAVLTALLQRVAGQPGYLPRWFSAHEFGAWLNRIHPALLFALDVLREEPPQPGNKVWGHAKAFVTPHIAAQASADTVARQCLENLRRLRAGEPLLNLVDVARGY